MRRNKKKLKANKRILNIEKRRANENKMFQTLVIVGLCVVKMAIIVNGKQWAPSEMDIQQDFSLLCHSVAHP